MTVKLIDDATALQSMRESDFDSSSAYGEVIDNSIQAGAKNVKIEFSLGAIMKRGNFQPITKLAFGDDGSGMNPATLNHCMQLGYSTRYNDRKGIGRFGVGMTLAALHECKKVDIYSKEKGSDWYYTYFDLDEIKSGEMDGIPKPKKEAIPTEYEKLVGKSKGTLIIWSKYDRQQISAEKLIEETKPWVGRTYRKFIWKGINIKINNKEVKAIDPLYVETKKTIFPDDPPADEYEPITIDWPIREMDRIEDGPEESEIIIRMSLVDEKLRPSQGWGRTNEAKGRYLHWNEGISILRNDREVFYGHIPYWPGDPFKEIDRYWGCEISFDAVLDRSFEVKNIKRGAIPNYELKRTINEQIRPSREGMLEKVREHWEIQKVREESESRGDEGSKVSTGHEDAESAVNHTPTDESNIDSDKNFEEESKKIIEAVKEEAEEEEKAAWIAKFKSQPFTILDESWKGPHFIESNHLGGKSVILYNRSHIFFQELYGIIGDITKDSEQYEAARKLKALVDLLLISFAKAETKFEQKDEWSPDKLFELLESNWGQYLKNYVETWRREHGES